MGRPMYSRNCNKCLLKKDGGVAWNFWTDYSNIQLLWSDFLYLSWFPPKTSTELSCNKVVLFCLYRHMFLCIYGLELDGMFKLYCFSSLYSMLIFFFLCAYTRWNGTKKLFAFLMKSSLNYTRAASLFWKDTLALFVQLEKYSSCVGGTAVHVFFCHYACLLHWRASLPMLVGDPRNGPVGEINLSTMYCAVLPLQGKSVAQCIK